MSERLDGRELLAIRARTARAHDGLHQGLAQTETDREALLREVYRIDAERRALKAGIERAREGLTAALAAWTPEHEYNLDRARRKGYSHNQVAAEVYGDAIKVVTEAVAALATPTPTTECASCDICGAHPCTGGCWVGEFLGEQRHRCVDEDACAAAFNRSATPTPTEGAGPPDPPAPGEIHVDRHGRSWDPHPFVQSRAVENADACICGQSSSHFIHAAPTPTEET